MIVELNGEPYDLKDTVLIVRGPSDPSETVEYRGSDKGFLKVVLSDPIKKHFITTGENLDKRRTAIVISEDVVKKFIINEAYEHMQKEALHKIDECKKKWNI